MFKRRIQADVALKIAHHVLLRRLLLRGGNINRLRLWNEVKIAILQKSSFAGFRQSLENSKQSKGFLVVVENWSTFVGKCTDRKAKLIHL